MADCQIRDTWSYLPGSSDGARTAIVGAAIIAVPGSNAYRAEDSAGAYRILGTNPQISTASQQAGVRVTTNSSGQFDLYLPQKGDTKPTSPVAQWTIIFPDGKQLYGEVPNAAGPVSVDDLITTYSWQWSSQTYVAPVTPGTLARGTAVFTAASSVAVSWSAAFASTAYVIRLAPSIDSSTGTIPAVAWASKTTTGFTLHASGIFTGSVDWEATL